MTKVTGEVVMINWPGEDWRTEGLLSLLLANCVIEGSYVPGKTDKVVVSFRPVGEGVPVNEKIA